MLAAAGCELPPDASGGSASSPVPREASPLGRAAPARPASGQEIDPTTIETRDDVVAIQTMWNLWPWRVDPERNVIGFKVPVYFVSAQTERGAFVSGTIFCWVYADERGTDGRRERKLVHMWELNHHEAMGFRVRRKAVGGYYYGFILTWPGTLDLAGRDIEVEFGYERRDGRLITTSQRLRVPRASAAGSRGGGEAQDAR